VRIASLDAIRVRGSRESRTRGFPSPAAHLPMRVDLVSKKSGRMCERAVLTDRPSLELSP
jgi:hypothetical protein